jgi:SAM-dependent methyltransferase
MPVSDPRRGPAYYDDQKLNYLRYWTGRTYEHAAEVMAIRRLLHGQSFEHAVDIGGGYGRISVVLRDFARQVTLVDSSQQQLDLAQAFLRGQPGISPCLMDAADLQIEDSSADLVTMIRVLHHLPEPGTELRELHRILRPGGVALIEVANIAHALNRVRYLVRRKPIPLVPVEVRTDRARQRDGIPFVNHHPATLVGQLYATGLRLERMLSVSNLRHRALTKSVPKPALLAVERVLQERFASVYFGPSIFLLLRKAQRGGQVRAR